MSSINSLIVGYQQPASLHSNSAAPSNGDVLHRIRLYHTTKNFIYENQYWSYLTRSKAKDLRHILRKEDFRHAFDKLLVIPGLCTDIKLGTLHRFLAMQCDEEFLHSLKTVKEYWYHVTDQNINWMKLIDCQTIRLLQCRALLASQADATFIHEEMRSCTLLPYIKDQGDQDMILQNIMTRQPSWDLLIPIFIHIF